MARIRTIGTGGGGGGGGVHNTLVGLQGAGPEYIHLSQAEYDTLVSGATPNIKSGVADLSSGVLAVTVTFAVPFVGAVDYKVEISFMNTVDATPNILAGIVTGRTLADMTVKIAGVADTNNYKMCWRAYR